MREPLVTALKRPPDYSHDLKRGTVAFDPEWKNYSYHTVVIPDGTKVVGCNFSQAVPRTDAIQGKNLTFVDCNHVNCLLDPSWTIINPMTVQNWLVAMPDGTEKRQFAASHPDQARNAVAPANAVMAREF